MSSKYFDLYIQSEGNESFSAIMNFMEIVHDKDWSKILNKYPNSYHYLVGYGGEQTGFKEYTREEMENEDENYGAIAQKSVNSKTDILVVGFSVGDKKLSKATELGVLIINEEKNAELLVE